MKTWIGVLMAVSVLGAQAAEIRIQKAQGDVRVRHGVTEQWTPVSAGDELRPHDSMKTGPGGSATLLVDMSDAGKGKKTLTLPAEVIVDVSDIRELTQEELMLKLTMAKVRSSRYEWRPDDGKMPDAAVIHGAPAGNDARAAENDPDTGRLQWNGARVLFQHGLYSTCVLRGLELFRLYPDMTGVVEHRMMIAEAMERAGLRGEASSEYGVLLAMPGLSDDEASAVQKRMEALRQ